jgi:DNA-binding Lrp family transcriptional regulator
MDDIDKKILYELEINADRSISQLAKELSLPRTTVNNRIKKMKAEGVIQKIIAIPDFQKLGYELCVFIHIVEQVFKSTDRDKVLQQLKKIKGVQELYATTGSFDIMAKVRVKHIEDISNIIFNPTKGLVAAGDVHRTESMVVIKTILENGPLI